MEGANSQQGGKEPDSPEFGPAPPPTLDIEIDADTNTDGQRGDQRGTQTGSEKARDAQSTSSSDNGDKKARAMQLVSHNRFCSLRELPFNPLFVSLAGVCLAFCSFFLPRASRPSASFAVRAFHPPLCVHTHV